MSYPKTVFKSREDNQVVNSISEEEVAAKDGYGDFETVVLNRKPKAVADKERADAYREKLTKELTPAIAKKVEADLTKELTPAIAKKVEADLTKELTPAIAKKVEADLAEKLTSAIAKKVEADLTEKLTSEIKAELEKKYADKFQKDTAKHNEQLKQTDKSKKSPKA